MFIQTSFFKTKFAAVLFPCRDKEVSLFFSYCTLLYSTLGMTVCILERNQQNSQLRFRNKISAHLRIMASITCLNPKAELARAVAALQININAAKGLQEVMKSNLGPKGTLKM